MVLEDDTASAPLNHTKYIERLDELEDRASGLTLPISYQPLLYALRLHIGVVRQRIGKSSAPVPGDPR